MSAPTNETSSPPRVRVGRLSLIALGLIVAAGVVAWQFDLFPRGRPNPRANAIMTIAPYRYQGTWVFDDSSVGLVREPFVAGVPKMIDELVKDIPDAEQGFRLQFSARPFPGHQKTLTWLRAESGGNYYALDDPPLEGWLCPALFEYYPEPPKKLYVQAEPIER